MKYVRTPKGYFFEVSKDGKKTRISEEKYNQRTKIRKKSRNDGKRKRQNIRSQKISFRLKKAIEEYNQVKGKDTQDAQTKYYTLKNLLNTELINLKIKIEERALSDSSLSNIFSAKEWINDQLDKLGHHFAKRSKAKKISFLKPNKKRQQDTLIDTLREVNGKVNGKVSNISNESNVVEEAFNPPMVIKNVTIKDRSKRKFNIIRDDFLCSGSKGRAVVPYFSSLPATHFVYGGPSTGYAQIVLAYGAAVCGESAHIFVEQNIPRNSLTEFAIDLGAHVVEVPPPNYLALVQRSASQFTKTLQKRIGKDKVHEMEFGFHEQGYIDLLADAVTQSIPPSLKANPPKRLWLVVGSGTVLHSIVKVWPKTHYLLVQVGRTVWPDLLEGIKHDLFVAPERFNDAAVHQPPYPTVSNYDAKLWQFVMKHGKTGDYVWNVGRDNPILIPDSKLCLLRATKARRSEIGDSCKPN